MIEPLAVNFDRYKKGSQLVRQELGKLLEKQKLLFPTKSMCNADNSIVRYTEMKQNKQIKWDSLMLRAPLLFSAYFRSISNKLMYGTKVQEWLNNVACQC